MAEADISRDYKREVKVILSAVGIDGNDEDGILKPAESIVYMGMIASKIKLSKVICCPTGLQIETKDIANESELVNVRRYAMWDQPVTLSNPTLVDICLTMGYCCANDKPRFDRLRAELTKVINAFPEGEASEWKRFAAATLSIQKSAVNFSLWSRK